MLPPGPRGPRLLASVPLVLAVSALVISCSGGNAASRLVAPPTFDPRGQAKCGVTKSQAKPLIVEWPSADRGQLEARARRKGLVAVRYEGCEMEVLDRCTAPGSYGYVGFTRKDDTITMRDADDLYASIPVHAAAFEAKLQKSGELDVVMTIVGRYESDRPAVRVDELTGDCARATHVVSAMTAGAFEFFAGAEAQVGAGVAAQSAGLGAHSSALRETLNRDGEKAACDKATPGDKEPPPQCGALLRLEVMPLSPAAATAAAPTVKPDAPPAAPAAAATPPKPPSFWCYTVKFSGNDLFARADCFPSEQQCNEYAAPTSSTSRDVRTPCAPSPRALCLKFRRKGQDDTWQCFQSEKACADGLHDRKGGHDTIVETCTWKDEYPYL